MFSLATPLSPPRTYAAWSECLDLLCKADNDERVLEAMQKGTSDFQSGAVQHLARRLNEVFNARLQQGHDRFNRQLGQSQDIATLSRALLDFRRQLTFLHRVATVTAFPATIQKHLGEMLDKAAQSTQESLEESAKLDRSGETMQCVRRHSLLTFRGDDFAGTLVVTSPAPFAGRGKRQFL